MLEKSLECCYDLMRSQTAGSGRAAEFGPLIIAHGLQLAKDLGFARCSRRLQIAIFYVV